MSLINWLKTKPAPRYYWCNTAAYGVESESKTPVPGSLGLLRFDNTRPSDDLWEPFGTSRYILPKETVHKVESCHPGLEPGSRNMAPTLDSRFRGNDEKAASRPLSTVSPKGEKKQISPQLYEMLLFLKLPKNPMFCLPSRRKQLPN
jgi:hypothetical protein